MFYLQGDQTPLNKLMNSMFNAASHRTIVTDESLGASETDASSAAVAFVSEVEWVGLSFFTSGFVSVIGLVVLLDIAERAKGFMLGLFMLVVEKGLVALENLGPNWVPKLTPRLAPRRLPPCMPGPRTMDPSSR
mmetsp:Transcript_5474/g.7150  ORF Transcript_5474/g.7150 Transcript_5474/m.7150 type:complete len:134 (+) Transcript_5474:90-491(+)